LHAKQIPESAPPLLTKSIKNSNLPNNLIQSVAKMDKFLNYEKSETNDSFNSLLSSQMEFPRETQPTSPHLQFAIKNSC